MPGSVLPSRYSRLAPPPVEMWPKPSSSKPSWRTAAAESPPPTTDSPSTSVSASATARVPSANGRDLEDAHRAVPEHRPGVGERRRRRPRRTPGRCRGRSGRPGIASAATTVRLARRRRTRGATTTSVGSTISHARLLGRVEVAAAGVELVLLEQAAADLVALRLEEGEDHAAADQQPVGLAEQVVDDAELVGDLRAAEHDDVGPLRVAR